MRTTTSHSALDHIPEALRVFVARRVAEAVGAAMMLALAALAVALMTWSIADPSLNHATSAHVHNWLGSYGAISRGSRDAGVRHRRAGHADAAAVLGPGDC